MQIDFDVMDPCLLYAVLIQGSLQILGILFSAEAELEVLVVGDENKSDTSYDEVGEAFLEVHWFLWCLL